MIDDSGQWDTIHKKIYQQNQKHSSYADEKEKLFPRGSLIVELGAGTGADVIYFMKKGHSVVALDISEFALKVLGEKAKREGLVKYLVTKKVDFGLHQIPVKDSSVNVVYSRISLNYFGKRQTICLLKDSYRILKTGGYAYISLKSPEDKNEMEYLKNSATVYEPNVYIEGGMLRSRFTKRQIEEMLKIAGISEFEVKPHQESLEGRGGGHHIVLFVNDIVFKKL